MSDTLWCDISQFQVPVDDSYPYRWLSFRSNDGNYHDPNFTANLAWCLAAITAGKLDGFIAYVVYDPNEDWVGTLINMVSDPHPLMAVMIDVESWGGRISGDHSDSINAGRARLTQWLGTPARVIGYGNMGDLNEIWPNRGDAQVVLAAYDWNPDFPGKIAHQFTSSGNVPPFGSPVDVNSADGYDSAALQHALGLDPTLASLNHTPFGAAMPLTNDDLVAILNAQFTFVQDGKPVTRSVKDALTAVYWYGDLLNKVLAGLPATIGTPVLSDAQMQTLEQGVATALAQSGVTLQAAQIDAISAGVRAQFTSNPLK